MRIELQAGLKTNGNMPVQNVANQNSLGVTNSINLKDSVSFSGKIERHPVMVDPEMAKFVANSLSTSTSGHRARYGSEKFNPEVVELLTVGVGQYAIEKAKEKGEKPRVIIGGDTRVATRKSLPLIKDTLSNMGVDVLYIKEPVATPLLALYTQEKDVDIAILLTASHNEWTDGGFNLVTNDGAIAPPSVTKKIANNVIKTSNNGEYITNKNVKGKVSNVEPYYTYLSKIDELNIINWDKIKDADISIYYDGLKGTGNNVFPKMLKEHGIKHTLVQSGDKTGPNPKEENLGELKESVKASKNKMSIGLANDGDADRFGVVDEKGNFITPNDVILLTAYHLSHNIGLSGDIVRSQATSSQLDLFAKNAGVNVLQTPVGFKYIAEDIIEMREDDKDILVAGEESGGLTINGHIPEKDGVIVLLTMLDLMASEGKPLSEILVDVKKGLGTEFRAGMINKYVNEESDKAIILDRARKLYEDAKMGNTAFGTFEIDVERTSENLELMEKYKKGGDGVKLYFTDGSSVLVRKSGTESLVKAYIETYNDNPKIADANVKELTQLFDNLFVI